MFEVQSHIPAPSRQDTWKSKLDILAIGESFAFPREKRNSVRQVISEQFHPLTAKRFTVSVKGQPDGVARVWRIEDKKEEADA